VSGSSPVIRPILETTIWSSAWAVGRAKAKAHLCHSLRVRTLADVERLAARMVEHQWPAIVRVAEALLADGELSGARIEALGVVVCRCLPSAIFLWSSQAFLGNWRRSINALTY
jgi:hypothetical protein